ncbi:MAG TPA: hypothetical protein VJI74_01130 [Candidatus Paceibacterota bacterium]
MRSIFTDNFPLIETESELQSLIKKYPSYDSYYVASGSIKERRDHFDLLYSQYYSFADKNFLSDVKRHFHQRTWEMYLSCVLLDNKIQISSEDRGPDILAKYEDRKVWIECVACERGDGKDQVPSIVYGQAQNVPTDNMLLRIASALKEKYEKYRIYLANGIIKETDPFIIAINGGAFGYPDGYFSSILRAVYAVGHPTISMPVSGGPTTHGVSRVPFIEKKNGSKVPMTFFLEKEHEGISAVIYARNSVLNLPDVSGKDLLIVYNGIAKNPLPSGIFSSFRVHKIDQSGNLNL